MIYKWVLIILLCFSGLLFFYLKKTFFSPSLPYLKVMTYPSFISPYGAGLEIQKKFESFCRCRIKWMKVEDSTLMIQRLQLRSDGLGVDVVFGLDQMMLPSASKMWKWKTMPISDVEFIPELKNGILFLNKEKTSSTQKESRRYWAVPINWAPMTFISKKFSHIPMSFQSLLAKQFKNKISLPHPLSSTVGLQFYFWLFSSFTPEERVMFLKRFKDQIYTLGHSWSVSYGLFQKDYVHLTFSYQTSLMYHLLEENKIFFEAVFSKGHPFQVEYAAIPSTCQECRLGYLFIKFLLRPDIQKILMYKNYMLPVVQNVALGSPFEQLQYLPLISYDKMEEFLSQKEELLKEWKEILY